jgi:hypothetical protein
MEQLWGAFADHDHSKALESLSGKSELYFNEDQVRWLVFQLLRF